MIYIELDNERVTAVFTDNPNSSNCFAVEGSIEQPERIGGKIPVLHYASERGFWYEYIDEQTTVQELVPLTNSDIEQLRQRAYTSESNPIMFAFRQYEMLGDQARAELKKNEWIAKVNEIRERYPYISE